MGLWSNGHLFTGKQAVRQIGFQSNGIFFRLLGFWNNGLSKHRRDTTESAFNVFTQAEGETGVFHHNQVHHTDKNTQVWRDCTEKYKQQNKEPNQVKRSLFFVFSPPLVKMWGEQTVNCSDTTTASAIRKPGLSWQWGCLNNHWSCSPTSLYQLITPKPQNTHHCERRVDTTRTTFSCSCGQTFAAAECAACRMATGSSTTLGWRREGTEIN